MIEAHLRSVHIAIDQMSFGLRLRTSAVKYSNRNCFN